MVKEEPSIPGIFAIIKTLSKKRKTNRIGMRIVYMRYVSRDCLPEGCGEHVSVSFLPSFGSELIYYEDIL